VQRPATAGKYKADKEQLGSSAIFHRTGAGHDVRRAKSSSIGMRLLMVLHRTFCELGLSLKLAFVGLDFKKNSTDVRQVCCIHDSLFCSNIGAAECLDVKLKSLLTSDLS